MKRYFSCWNTRFSHSSLARNALAFASIGQWLCALHWTLNTDDDLLNVLSLFAFHSFKNTTINQRAERKRASSQRQYIIMKWSHHKWHWMRKSRDKRECVGFFSLLFHSKKKKHCFNCIIVAHRIISQIIFILSLAILQMARQLAQKGSNANEKTKHWKKIQTNKQTMNNNINNNANSL